MSFFLGVVLFAVGIALTIALHEWGHLTAARACGMRVRRYFVGFGPTVWSFKRRHAAAGGHMTEYGLKAIPLGGFCDIAGMTAQDEVMPEEESFVMWRKPWWQRIIVLFGGVIMNLLIGVVIIYAVAVAWGLPNLNQDLTPRVSETMCVPAKQFSDGTTTPCNGNGPAAQGGIRPGDVIVAVSGHETKTYPEVVKAVEVAAGTTLNIEIDRNGKRKTVEIAPVPAQRVNSQGQSIQRQAIGISFARPNDAYHTYSALSAIPGTFVFTGQLFGAVWDGLLSIPGKVPGVVSSIFGGVRDPESPMSVVGASRAGGELVQASMWSSFLMLLANLNFFLALFNLVPLPPLDGGHVIVVIYEKIRDLIRKLAGKPAKGPADYQKLMPITMGFTAILLVFGVLVIAADLVNPIRLFG